MFSFICKAHPHVRSSFRTSATTNRLYFVQHHPLSSATPKSNCNSSNQHPFTVSYLVNSCGFSLEKAQSASNYMNIETPDKPDSVVVFFENRGFTKTQISTIVKKYPPVLLCRPQKTLLPKLEFFRSVGVSSTDIPKIICLAPSLLKRSLENQIIPSFNFFRTLLQSNEKTVAVIKRWAPILCCDLETHVGPNIETLRELGVPESNILYLLIRQPRYFTNYTNKFRETVEEVKEMGFNPLEMVFILAVHALGSMTKSTWEKKVELYKKWGWSEDEILVAFGKRPWCMTVSKDKITGVMDFLVNKMGLESSFIAKRPQFISLSLEKRIVPRCSVYQVLLAKGLIKKECSLSTLLAYPERLFVQKIVTCYREEGPELLRLYKEKLALSK